MKRRGFLTEGGIVISLTIAGCLTDEEEQVDDEQQGNKDHGEDKEILIDGVQLDDGQVDENSDKICQFDELSSDVQREVRKAIEEDIFTKIEPTYGTGHDCYGVPIRYQGEFYRVLIAQ